MKFTRSLNLPMYPFMAALVPVLLFYNTQAVMEVPVDALLLPCVAVIAMTVVLYLVPCVVFELSNRCIRSVRATECGEELGRAHQQTDAKFEVIQIWALWTAIAWTMFFSLSYCIELYGVCSAFNLQNCFSFSAIATILPFLFLLVIVLAVIPMFKRRWLPRISSAMHQTFAMLLIVQIAATTWYFVNSEFMIKPAVESIQRTEILNVALKNSGKSAQNRTEAGSSGSKPDIYYIILDEMASSSVLAHYVNYDDAWFRKALEERGFFVTRNSLSNYPMTRLSISSSLNMTYLDKFVEVSGKDSSDLTLTAVLMRNSAVGRLLQKHGYKYIHVDSAFPPTNNSYLADRVIHCGFIDQFNDKLISSTLVALSPQARAWLDQQARETILNQFAAPGKVALETTDRQNVFVFSHIICPHFPFLFDADGAPVLAWTNRNSRWADDTVAAYAGQAKFAQRKAIATIDSILKSSRMTGRKPLIILQGDHGTHSSDRVSTPDPTIEFLHERYGILNAYLVPDDIRSQLNDETEPVNTFRIVLRTLFDLDLPNLEARQTYATYNRFFDFRDVTAQVRDQARKTEIVQRND